MDAKKEPVISFGYRLFVLFLNSDAKVCGKIALSK
jgi:hypothetical protein